MTAYKKMNKTAKTEVRVHSTQLWPHPPHALIIATPQMESFREYFVLSFRDSFTESQLTHSRCLLAQLASLRSQLGVLEHPD